MEIKIGYLLRGYIYRQMTKIFNQNLLVIKSLSQNDGDYSDF